MGIEGALGDRSDCLAFLANTAESPQRQDRFIQRIRERAWTVSSCPRPRAPIRGRSTSCAGAACPLSRCCAMSAAEQL